MEDIEYLGFIQFYTDNQSVEPKQTFVLLFREQLKLRQKLVHAEFFDKLTIVTIGALRVKQSTLGYTYGLILDAIPQ